MYKYTINILLYKMNKHECRMALLNLPGLLNVSSNTLHRWRYISIDSYFDIPFTKLVQLAEYFDVKPQDMYTDFERTLDNDFNRKKDEL